MAEELDISEIEALELLSDIVMESQVTYDDNLQGFEDLRTLE